MSNSGHIPRYMPLGLVLLEARDFLTNQRALLLKLLSITCDGGPRDLVTSSVSCLAPVASVDILGRSFRKGMMITHCRARQGI